MSMPATSTETNSSLRYRKATLAGSMTATLAALSLLAQEAQARELAAEPAIEQSPEDDATAAAGDIVVTAQKRSESMMKVPVAISAFTGETLTNAGISNVQTVQMATPSLVYNNTGAYAQPFIRGVGSRLLLNGLDPSVATYVDGRYISRQTAISLDLFDVQRVEVLKGPQGVLFGRNASAGAIRVITNPVTSQAEGMFKAGFGNYDALTVQAMGNMPLTDNLGIRVSGMTMQRKGFARNMDPAGRREWDDKNLTAVRGKARYDDGTFDANLTLSYWRENDNIGNDTVALGLLQYHAGLLAGGQTGIGYKHVATKIRDTIKKEEFAGELTLGVDLGGARLSSISTFADLDNVLGFEGDGTSAVLVDPYIPEKSRTYSQEIQLSSDNDGPLEWIAGAYYYHDKTAFEIVINVGPRIISQGNQIVKTESYAAFGQLGWTFSDSLKLVVGGRYTKDKKSLDLIASKIPGLTTVVPPFNDAESWSKFTPSATLEYTVADTLLYAKFARGFKSGGFNYPAVGQQPLDPEVLDMYELGLKSSLFDRAVRLTLSGYYYDYKDLQVTRAAAAGSVTVITQNAANARLYGIDADVVWNPTPELTLTGGFAWQNSKYKNYDLATAKVYRALQPGGSGGGMIDIPYAANGERLLRAPKLSAYAAINYDIPVGNATVPVNISYSYKGSYNFDFVVNPNTSVLRQKAYSLVNARIGYEPAGGRWSAAIWANNLFDERYFDDVVAAGTGIRGSWGAPRTYGGEVTFRF